MQDEPWSHWDIVEALADRERRARRGCHRCAGTGLHWTRGVPCATCDGTGEARPTDLFENAK